MYDPLKQSYCRKKCRVDRPRGSANPGWVRTLVQVEKEEAQVKATWVILVSF